MENKYRLDHDVEMLSYDDSVFNLLSKIVVVFDSICIRSFLSNAHFL